MNPGRRPHPGGPRWRRAAPVLVAGVLLLAAAPSGAEPPLPLPSTGMESNIPFDQVVVEADGAKTLTTATPVPDAPANTDWGPDDAPLDWADFNRKMTEEGLTLTLDGTKRVLLEPPSREARARSSAAFLVEAFRLRRESEGRFQAYITEVKTQTPLILELQGMFGHTAIVQTSSRFRELTERDQQLFVQEWSLRWHQEVNGPLSRLIVTDPQAGRLYAFDRFDAVENRVDPLTIPLLAVNERFKEPPPPPSTPGPATPAAPAP